MRPPRYKFPNEVRSTTRAIASRMVRDGSIPQNPEQLHVWISEREDVRASLEKGGYGQAFTAEDLFPLLEVFVAQSGGPPTVADAPPAGSPSQRLRVAPIVAIGAVLVLVVLAIVLLR